MTINVEWYKGKTILYIKNFREFRKVQIERGSSSRNFLLFSAHCSYGKGKYLNQTGFFVFTKFAMHEIYIHLKGRYP